MGGKKISEKFSEQKSNSFFSKIMNVEVFYDIHSINRSLERSITAKEIESAIDNKNSVVMRQNNGRFRLTCGNLTIILDYNHGKMNVITVYFNRRGEKCIRNF
jgi:hypothetical protein